MLEKPYKCPVCHSSFRTESGMMSHLSRQHETDRAVDEVRKTYEVIIAEQNKDIAQNKQEAENSRALALRTTSDNARLISLVTSLQDEIKDLRAKIL